MTSEPENGRRTEHYCTLFDIAFLPQGLALQASLSEHAGEFTLWVLCMDVEVEEALRDLALPSVQLLPLRQLESEFPGLLEVKPTRELREYCWTLTPFLTMSILSKIPKSSRATYLDADLYFFASPAPIFQEFSRSKKHVLITEHNYARECDSTKTSGRFCVQFIPFRNTAEAHNILLWWQDRCLEWCFDRIEPGRFGDQMYLDSWPSLFDMEVHVLQDLNLAMAPWNARIVRPDEAVFYHMHSLRIWDGWRVRLVADYRIPKNGLKEIYSRYLGELVSIAENIHRRNINLHFPAPPNDLKSRAKRIRSVLLGKEIWNQLPVHLNKS